MTLKCEVVSNDDGKCLKLKEEDEPATMVTVKFDDKQKVKILLSGTKLAPTATNKDIELQFSVLSDDSPPEILLVFNEKWNIKNNSNTNLDEVLKGEAIFVYDKVFNDDHKGKTTGAANKTREVDFIQKMINHIAAPLEGKQSNTISVDGYYGDDTKNALVNILNDTNVNHHMDEENSFNTFNKLVKDYSDLNETDIGHVIDKEILLGVNQSGEDKHPEDHEDIGIYELYICDDWDEDGLSNYVEVENGLNPLLADAMVSVERGTYNNGLIVKSLRIANINKGYYYFKSKDTNDTDNYGTLRALQTIEAVAKQWESVYPDLYPLKKDIFVYGGYDNLDINDDDKDNNLDNNTWNEVRIGIGDISKQPGGPFLPHETHQNGLNADIRYVMKNNTEARLDVRETYELFSQEYTEALINLFIQHGATKIIIDPETKIQQTSIIILDSTGKHSNHIHVNFPIVNVPTGQIVLNPSTSSIPADGNSAVQITSEPIKDKYKFPLLQGILIEVTATNGTIVEGQNIGVDQDGRLLFTLRLSTSSGESVITARSIEGDALGTITVEFTTP